MKTDSRSSDCQGKIRVMIGGLLLLLLNAAVVRAQLSIQGKFLAQGLCCLGYPLGALSRRAPASIVRYAQSHAFDGAFGAKTDMTYLHFFGRDFITGLYER